MSDLNVIRVLNLNDDDETIFRSLKLLVLLGQCFGLLPQEGTTRSPSGAHLKFKWLSWRVIYTFFIMLILAGSIASCFVHSLVGTFTFDHLVTSVFFIVGLLTLALYLRLARSFSNLIRDWAETDRIMNRDYGYPQNLARRLKIITIVGLGLVIGDYLFGVGFHIVHKMARFNGDLLRTNFFFKTTFPAIFYYRQTPINVIGIFASISTWLCTFICNFNDLFIVEVSTVLALRFEQISDCLVHHERKANSNQFWIVIRKNYDSLSVLCKKLDSNISFIILLSFASNIFFVLVQLFYSFGTIDDTLDKLYFFYAFSHLICRLAAVSLYAAWINDASKEPANILNSLPSATYNLEIRRLLLQISFDNVALTGSKMFKITRGLILSVASAVVTYELVLIQFNTAASS